MIFLELPGGTPAWSVQLASKLSPIRYAPVCLRSNRWHGAVTVGYNEKFANIYVGWGLKELGRPFVPAPLPAVQSEYGIVNPTPEEAGLQEATEVSLEEEKAYNEANKVDDEQEKKEPEEEEDA
jgi:radial spoke head protein 4A